MTNTPFRPVLRSQSDVHAMWRTIINPLGWHSHRLYVVLIDADGRPLPVIHEVDEIPERIPADEADSIVGVFKQAQSETVPDGRCALLYCRPGAGGVGLADRLACLRLYAAAQTHRLPLEVIHVATDTAIVPAPLDAMAARVS